MSSIANTGAGRRVLMVNDRAIYNGRYRSPVIAELTKRGHKIESLGFFDGFAAFVSTLRAIRHPGDAIVVSSNLKCNILIALFGHGRRVIVLNGMGRFRASRRFRALLLRLLASCADLQVVVQSYADYRYLRRLLPELVAVWVPGSGGSAKPRGPDDILVLVQRDKKIALVVNDVVALLREFQPAEPLVVVGCTDAARLARLLPLPHRSVGYVPTDEIFSKGGIFLQPSGYGEGFPHALADALASGMEVVISDREALRYGLYRLGAGHKPVCPGWSRLHPGPELVAATSAASVGRCTADICEGRMSLGEQR